MEQQQFKELLRRYQHGEASKPELVFLEAYYAAFEARPDVLEALSGEEQTILEDLLFTEMRKQLPTEAPVRKIAFLKHHFVRYAAAILIVLCGSVILWTLHKTSQRLPAEHRNEDRTADILPGKDGAVLTLEDGRQIVLDSMGNGLVAEQQGNRAMLKEGTLVYDQNQPLIGDVAYNTMHTPRGRQFRMELPDGTKVWMNAASQIRYPVSFSGKDRKVQIEGECYFEVAKDSKRPFIVELAKGTTVQVLGTRFNVNAYQDEPETFATLLEGVIRIKAGNKNATLVPGQQANISSRQMLRVRNDVDVDKVMAWKNGFFSLENTDIKAVMRQLERWYDVEVRYEGVMPDLDLKGELNRGVKLSAVINWLTEIGLNCRLEGRMLIVMGN